MNGHGKWNIKRMHFVSGSKCENLLEFHLWSKEQISTCTVPLLMAHTALLVTFIQ